MNIARNGLTVAQVLEFNSNLGYASELTEAMSFLAMDPRTVFIGQAIRYPGTAVTNTLKNVPMDRRIEMPVAEQLQMGISIGMSLNGFIPVTIYPRWNFLLLAMSELVNHLDKLPLISEYRPKVIVRTVVGSERPLNPGPQHLGNFTKAFKSICQTIKFVELEEPENIVPAYKEALARDGSTVLVEFGDYYQEK